MSEEKSDSKMKRVLSAIQPTGDMHYGNYFGAVKNWVDLQDKYQCFYGVVDYHSMTMPYNVKKLRNNTWELVTNLVAVGVKPENLFVQSLIPEHTELGWILNCYSSFGQVSRMTQFKDKSDKAVYISTGLFTYPVLQAADILIYKANYVPVGKDQDQHLELTRDIVQRFNSQVGKDYFVSPKTLHTITPKIQSTADPMRKMSKSAGEKHYVNVFSEESRIRKQIKSAVTSSETTMSPGVTNLIELLNACGMTNEAKEYTDLEMAGKLKYSDLKESVANALVEMSNDFIDRKNEIMQDKRRLKDQVRASSAEIRKVAQETLREVKDLVGLLNVKF